MNKVHEFVITGGPSAGKTTGLTKLEETFSEKGYKVIIVPETATEVILSGITPTELPTFDFQRVIIERGINKEKTVRKIAPLFDKDVIIFYDRGLLDSKAYMEHKDFVRILKSHKMSEIEADKKTRDAWVGHPHLRVIDNSTGFNDKIDRLIKEVYASMGIPTPIETERKFLIKLPSQEQLIANKCVKSNIVQTYLRRRTSDVERRVRQRGIDGEFSYYYTEKKKLSECSRDEVERKISKDEYIALLLEATSIVRKDRYCFFYENQYFELDVYPDWLNGEAILEIELTEEGQEVKLPDWITVIKEVTGDENYSNAKLAK